MAKAIDDCAAAWKDTMPNAEGLPCDMFLKASFATTAVFDLLGSIVSQVSKDINSNANKLRKATGSDSGSTLEQIIAAEVAAAGGDASKAAKEGSAALALLWLARYLRLVEVMLATMVNEPQLALRDCIRSGYDTALKPHHNFLTRKTLGAAIYASPDRAFFYGRLGTDTEGCAASIQEMLSSYAPIMRRAHDYLAGLGLEAAPPAAAA
uniref:Glycolipid transfer protein domain-containing protein n=1 Tax=Prymnesium polylepis TaxID=72548 RepID=A0A7S4J3W2_9EUKA